MAEHSTIEWTDATWNPVTGCSVVSPGCTNCYAMKLAGTRLAHHPSRAGLTVDSKAGPVWNGKVRLNEEWLTQPLRWKRPRMIFVCAHGDLFHESVPDEWIDRVFAVMALCPQHTFQVLTKRSARMRAYMAALAADFEQNKGCGGKSRIEAAAEAIGRDLGWDHDVMRTRAYEAQHDGFPNVWLGVSAEDQTRYDERADDLRNTPAALRFFSFEPLLGPITADYLGDWAIVGGESGRDARPMHPDWARGLRDQCQAAGVPFFFKQWGEWREAREGDVFDTSRGRLNKPPAFIVDPVDGTVHCFMPSRPDPRYRAMLKVGKKAAGALLDGREWREMPQEARRAGTLVSGPTGTMGNRP